MTNADGRKVRLTEALSTQRMLAAKERRAWDLTVACANMGDARNAREALADLASIKRVEAQLAGAS